MNCDQVFDVLTRGPFPTGTDCDVPVEAHLNHCADCRRLAEALRPALELFQEAVDPEESRDLPGYWGAEVEGQRASVSYASQVEAKHSLPNIVSSVELVGHTAAGTAWRMAAMVALGIALGSLASARWALDGSAWSDTPRSNSAWSDTARSDDASEAPLAPLARPSEAPRNTLAERLGLTVLPALCLQKTPPVLADHNAVRGDLLLADVSLANVNCCTGCHHAQSDLAPPAATAKVAQSCQLCHVSRP